MSGRAAAAAAASAACTVTYLRQIKREGKHGCSRLTRKPNKNKMWLHSCITSFFVPVTSDMIQVESIYGGCVGLNPGQSPTKKVWPEQITQGIKSPSSVKSFRCLPVFIHQTKTLKKDSQKSRFMAVFYTQLVLPQTKRRPPHFHLTWITAQPPPLPSALSVSGG